MAGMKPRSPFRNKAIYSIGKRYYMKGKSILRTKSKRYTVGKRMHVRVIDVSNTRCNARDTNITIHAKAIILGNVCK